VEVFFDLRLELVPYTEVRETGEFGGSKGELTA
jgi:hypothetical protein